MKKFNWMGNYQDKGWEAVMEVMDGDVHST